MTVRGNPFDVLGLQPEAIEGLSDDRIMEVVTALAVVQLAIHNPQKGGDLRRFEAIKMALESLKDQEVFNLYRAEHLLSRDEKIRRLQRDLRKCRVQLNDLRRSCGTTV